MDFKRILDNAAIFSLGMAMGHGNWFIAIVLVTLSIIGTFVEGKGKKAPEPGYMKVKEDPFK